MKQGEETSPHPVTAATSFGGKWSAVRQNLFNGNCARDNAHNKLYFESMPALDVGVKNNVCGMTIKTKPLMVHEYIVSPERKGKCFDGGYEVKCDSRDELCDSVHHICVKKVDGKCKYEPSGVDWCSPLAKEGDVCARAHLSY